MLTVAVAHILPVAGELVGPDPDLCSDSFWDQRKSVEFF